MSYNNSKTLPSVAWQCFGLTLAESGGRDRDPVTHREQTSMISGAGYILHLAWLNTKFLWEEVVTYGLQVCTSPFMLYCKYLLFWISLILLSDISWFFPNSSIDMAGLPVWYEREFIRVAWECKNFYFSSALTAFLATVDVNKPVTNHLSTNCSCIREKQAM